MNGIGATVSRTRRIPSFLQIVIETLHVGRNPAEACVVRELLLHAEDIVQVRKYIQLVKIPGLQFHLSINFICMPISHLRNILRQVLECHSVQVMLFCSFLNKGIKSNLEFF